MSGALPKKNNLFVHLLAHTSRMAPIKPFSKQAFPFASNGAFGEFGLNKDGDGFYGDESVSDRGWEMGEESEIIEDDMGSEPVIMRDDITLDDLEDISGSDMNTLGPEMDTFAQFLDTMRTKIISHPGDKASSEKASYDIIETFRTIARKRREDHEITCRDLSQSDDQFERDNVIYARDASGQYISMEVLAKNIQYWVMECQTWDLFALLLKHRLSKESRPASDNPGAEFDRNSSDLKYKEYLMHLDPQFKELNIILDWVRRNAPPPLDVGDRKAAGYTYTKQTLKAMKRQKQLGGGKRGFRNFVGPQPGEGGPGSPNEAGSDLVTELDPDAPARQGKLLEAEDFAFEQRLMRAVFGYLRAGDLAGAMNKCRQVEEYWRAQSFAGGCEAWDIEIDGPRDGNHGLEGNKRRELWRRMCYKLATEAASGWESAVYGVLSGDLGTVLPACRTWEDHLFAHLNSLIETQYYNYLAAHRRIPALVQKFPVYDAIQHHGGQDAKFLPRIIDTLRNNGELQDEIRESQRIIQGALMSERLTDIVAELSRQLDVYKKDPEYEPSDEERSRGLDISDFRLLRVVVHILLVLKGLDAGFSSETPEGQQAENVIAGYMELLAEAGKHELIPLYAGHLSKKRASKVMGEILVKVINEDTRVRLLGLMKDYDIDIPDALRHMINNVFELTHQRYARIPLPSWTGILAQENSGINDSSLLKEEDEQMIRALEWMLLVPELKQQIMGDGCIAYKRFFLTGRLAAARELLKRIPSTMLVPQAGTPLSESFDHVDSDGEVRMLDRIDLGVEKAMQAAMYMEFEFFLKGILALEDWKEALHKATEIKRERIFKSELEQAYEKLQSHTLPVAKAWFLAHFQDASGANEVTQIKTIRNTYIPDLVLALHQVYVDAGKYLRKNLYTQTLELATAVGSNTKEGQEIARCFVETGKLRDYVNCIAEASRMILGAAQASGREVTRRGVAANGAADLQIWNVK